MRDRAGRSRRSSSREPSDARRTRKWNFPTLRHLYLKAVFFDKTNDYSPGLAKRKQLRLSTLSMHSIPFDVQRHIGMWLLQAHAVSSLQSLTINDDGLPVNYIADRSKTNMVRWVRDTITTAGTSLKHLTLLDIDGTALG